MAASWRPDQLDPPRPVPAPVMRATRHQAVQSSRKRKGTRCRAACPRGAAREDWGGDDGTHSRMRRARGKPRSRRVDDGDRDAGVHGGEQKQGVRPHLVGRDRLVQARQEAPGFEGVRGRLIRSDEPTSTPGPSSTSRSTSAADRTITQPFSSDWRDCMSA